MAFAERLEHRCERRVAHLVGDMSQPDHTMLEPHSFESALAGEQLVGQAYLGISSSLDVYAEKYWSNQALASQRGRIRMGDSVYPVTLRRVTDADELELAWSARLSKLGMERATPRPAHWWSFHLTSR